MLAVEDARAIVLNALEPVPEQWLGLGAGLGRVLARDLAARVTQPPVAVSAMDGYAVRAADTSRAPTTLRLVGEAAAGRAWSRALGAGETARIFTGAPLPEAADAVVIQEDAAAEGTRIAITHAVAPGRFVRPAGLDFRTGEVLLKAGRCLRPADLGLAAAMNVAWLPVRRRPRIALLATGNELRMPGQTPAPAEILNSNSTMFAAYVEAFGGEPIDLGIARDREDELAAAIDAATGSDLLVTLGGASVGDHDLVRPVLAAKGFSLAFYRVAMRPGKPVAFGRLGDLPVLSLPGNPASVAVSAAVLVEPAIRTLQGRTDAVAPLLSARLGCALPANDVRQEYRRARLERTDDGGLLAHPFAGQDSAMLRLMADADCLVVRPPHAPAAALGDRVRVLRVRAGP
jgi:molybdopterin molybdotransferase